MPTVSVTGVTVSHIWDDNSQSDIEISMGEFEDTGPYVSEKDDRQVIFLRPESWPEIRDQIDNMFSEMEAKDGD